MPQKPVQFDLQLDYETTYINFKVMILLILNTCICFFLIRCSMTIILIIQWTVNKVIQKNVW